MIPKPSEHVAIIADPAALAAFVTRMMNRDWIAVDTEFLRERTYYPRLCLIQIGDGAEIGLIDPLAIERLEPLAELFAEPAVIKVFHSAEQDLEVLHQRFGGVPAPLFDTQIAAALLGYDDQMGYARLVQALLDVTLSKAHTRTDWSRRPLPVGALDYAADDVRYLAQAYEMLRDRLLERGRLAWLDQECHRLADPARFAVDPGRAWRRLRGWHRLDASAQQVLAELAAWREQTAIASDRPRRWVLPDDALTDVARRQPCDARALGALDALPARTAERHGDALLACVARGLAHPPATLATHPAPPDPQTKRRIKIGMQRLAERADAENIAAALLASRQDIAALVAGERDRRLLTGWRARIAGDAVLEAITEPCAEPPPAAE